MTTLKALLAALLAVSASAYHFNPGEADGSDEGISAHDGKGTIYTVYNLFDGRNSAIQVSRLANGGVAWTVEHADGVREKAAGAAVDAEGNLVVVGERSFNRERYILLLKFSPTGALVREVVDNADGCSGSSVAIDHEGWVVAAGLCKQPRRNPVRLVKFDADLGYYWQAEYDRGGRNYLRGLSVDARGVIFAVIETVLGDFRDGSYRTVTALYSPEGRLEDER